MKKIVCLLLVLACCTLFAVPALAATQYRVVKGDSMWKIAVRYQVGLSEIIAANPQVKNPALIYPGDLLTIPGTAPATLSFEEQAVKLVNQQRAAAGLPALKANWELARVARYKSTDMSQKKYFAHNSPTYGAPGTMIRNFGINYRAAGENIAMGYATPQAVMNGWMNSPGHRANILNRSFTQIGVGYVANGHYWTQMFIG
ncbi:MAG: SafA/ExsA family spore coat assembly protein [Eubacteriales bacterium]